MLAIKDPDERADARAAVASKAGYEAALSAFLAAADKFYWACQYADVSCSEGGAAFVDRMKEAAGDLVTGGQFEIWEEFA